MDRRTFLKLGLTGVAMSFAPKAWALKYFPKTSGKKWAVIYSTWCGSSRDAGVWISEGMNGIADVFDVRENPDLRKFDNIIIGSSVRGFKIHPLMKKFLQESKSILRKKVRGLYIVCGNLQQPPGEQQKKQYIDDQLSKLTDSGNIPGKVFLGRMTGGLLDEEGRKLMESFGPIIDYDNLKRSDCLLFGKEILKNS